MTAQSDTLFSQSAACSTKADEFAEESASLAEQAEALGWDVDAETSQQATELWGQSWGALAKAAEAWGEGTTYDLKVWADSDETLATLYTETGELYTQWKDACEAAEEVCTRIAKLYGEEASEEDLDELWAEHDEHNDTHNDITAKIDANEEQIASKLDELASGGEEETEGESEEDTEEEE